MIETILPDIFRIEVPLPNNPLRSINSYVVKGGERDLLVDTGMNRPECVTVLQAALSELGTVGERTDLFITHFHADHLGLAAALASDASRVYFNQPEHQYLAANRPLVEFWDEVACHARMEGFPETGIEQVRQMHPGFRKAPPKHPDFTILHDGDRLTVGDYQFTCIHTPGHTIGHLCLYDAQRRLLISGDHVLGDITPNIASWIDDRDTLGDYFASLDRVARLDVDLVLPGHRRTFHDLRGRVGELKAHHQQRLEEALSIIRTCPGTVYETASRMTWDIVAPSWEDFPLLQKWFATGEAGSHLRHLFGKGILSRTSHQGFFSYNLCR